MTSLQRKFALTFLLLLTVTSGIWAQGGIGASNYLVYGLAAVAILILFFIIVSVSDTLLVSESRQSGADRTGANFSVFPRMNEIFRPKLAKYLEGKRYFHFSRGYDLQIKGEPENVIDEQVQVTRFAIKPTDFIGMQPIPKVVVEIGDTVKAGDTLFYDKTQERIKFVAPVSGEVIDVKRGMKRSIAEIVILADREQVSRTYDLPDLATANRSQLVDFLVESGAWPIFRQRPFNVIADPEVTPRDIFVSTFDTAPLAPDLSFTVEARMAEFQAGIDVLNKLTDGIVYLGLDARGDEAPSPVFTNVQGVQHAYFQGKHPAGNVGVHIHHLHPVGPQDRVWTLDVNGVLLLGELLLNGRYDTSRLVSLGGYAIAKPGYVRTYAGANLGELLRGQLLPDHNARIITGDVLNGRQASEDQFMDYYENSVSVIDEGNEAELFGWLLPLKERESISPTFPGYILGGKKEVTTNTHGEKRAFVTTNDYERVMPMDIYTQQLMKAILVNDFERMEGLGIHELVEEDVALAEFSCVSKQPLQQILRNGLDVVREQS